MAVNKLEARKVDKQVRYMSWTQGATVEGEEGRGRGVTSLDH